MKKKVKELEWSVTRKKEEKQVKDGKDREKCMEYKMKGRLGRQKPKSRKTEVWKNRQQKWRNKNRNKKCKIKKKA